MAFHELVQHLHAVPTQGSSHAGDRPEADLKPGVTAPRWLLVLLTAIGPASFQIFLPSLPGIRAGFGVAAGTAQLALSLSMLGIAAATLAYGSLSDRFGRRPVLLGGMGLLVAGSLICATAPSIWTLIAGRIVQAAGGAAGMVVTRAIVVDVYGREQAGRVLAGLLAAMMIAPLLATPLGGVLNDLAGWRVNFLAIAVAAAVTLVMVWRRLPETRRQRESDGARRAGLLADYRRLLGSRCFNGFALQGAFAMAAFTAFNTAAPYALSGSLGLTATQVGLTFVAVSVGFAAGSLGASRMPDTIGLSRRALLGSAAGFAAAGAGLALALAGTWTVWALVAPAALFALATGVTMPASQAGAMNAVPELSGTASGLSGFMGTALAAAATQVVGTASNGTPLPVAWGLALLAAASLVAALLAFHPGFLEPLGSEPSE
ncbi:MAG TPA: multidrug effflux MFS transporter [Sphingomonas sp.]|jgi:DHA1 family bicyclomycin/chloramphenicol resistance-like MFS transporter